MKKLNIKNSLATVILIIGALIAILPFIWMIITSLKDGGAIYKLPPEFWLKDPKWENYQYVASKVPMARYFINSLFVTIMITSLTLVTTILAAFAFSRLEFFGRDVIFTILISTMMVPGEVLIAPNFITLARLGLINTMTSLYLPWIASAFSIFFLRQYFLGIPEQLYYASKVDGASDFQYLIKIMVPYAKPALISIALLRVVNSWNEFLWPLLMVNTPDKRTLPVGLATFMTEAGAHYHWLMAYATVVILPIIILYILLYKYIIQGFVQGGIKG